MLIDTHCHLGAEQFAGEVEAVLERAWAAGLAHLIVIGESPAALDQALAIIGDEPRLSATAGLHPHQAAEWHPGSGEWLRKALADPRVVAVGEMGLDYHYDHSPREVQRAVFDEQMGVAVRAGKPAVIHARDADADVAAILRNHPDATVILHSFSSGPDLLRAALDAGHYVSFSGIATFRNWGRDDMIRAVSPERLLVETDAPYLAPVPMRGRRNEPAFVRHTAERLAVVCGVSAEELVEQMGANAARVFGPRVRV